MADALKPWIAKYLEKVAEEHGAQLYKAHTLQKPRKIQLIQFLTYSSESQPSYVWAIASDKSHKLPIRLNAEAVKKHQSKNGRRLTKDRTAVVSIKGYKPIFCRAPTEGYPISEDARLCLECDEFSVLGSLGEACFGEPKFVEEEGNLRLWSEGLKQEGGAGNVLKNRKSQVQYFTEEYEKRWNVEKRLEHPEDREAEKFEILTSSRWLSWEEVYRILGSVGKDRGWKK